ncbi:serine-rich adhesin for platelets [Anopheles darlingi]|uniref:serine-rich adhesin for platelets n=1 Tax=Anopheles darlingi TaxID=43151 RepID=UPI0021001425|nr:serine-rich adhesin for platelets [Anopheles darlingi]XP_049536401.1 serine-rich adhesin for platelets [Anopheles darlingi]
MPRIDPMKLLVCLSVLLAPNGGIRTSAEVKRLANLMAKFSKKLVSKCIYIQILKCTETELLGQFMQTGGWSLVHLWLVDGVTSKNWPLIQELLELLLCCPVDVERLKINTTPRLVKALSTDSAHERVRVLASKLVEQWLFIVKAPKQLSPSIPLNPSDVSLGDHSVTDGQPAILGGGVQEETNNNVGLLSESTSTGNEDGSGCHLVNGIGGIPTDAASTEKDFGNKQGLRKREDDVDSAKKSFRAIVEQEPHKKTSLVLKITTKNGKQVVTEVRTPTSAINGDDVLHRNGMQADGDDIEEEEEEEEEDEEVVVNIESEKPNEHGEIEAKDAKKNDLENGREGRERSGSVSSSSKDHRSHHSSRDREKDRKGSSSSGSRSSSSKSSSGSSSSSGSKSKSSSGSSKSSSSSSSSRDKDKDRHGSSSSNKHKSSSSSSSKSSGSGGSKSSRSSSDKHRDHRDKSSHSGGSSSNSSKDNKDSKSTSLSPSTGGSRSSTANLSRKSSKDDGGNNDSGSETGSTSANNSANMSGVSSKKASISIEVRNPENRVKTVKTYNSQFRSHGLIEEAPPPPSRKGLKKPSSGTSSSAASTTGTGSATVVGTKRLSPAPSSSPSSVRDTAGAPLEKRLKEDPTERPGAIKLIAPKRQHALVESDMFMDALSATLRKDVKKRKRRTSGSDSNTTTTTPTVGIVGATKPAESNATGATKSSIPDSPTKKTMGSDGAGGGDSDALESVVAPTKETTPVTPPPIVAPMSFYRDTLAEDDEQSTAEVTEEGKKDDATKEGIKKEEEEEDGDEAEAVTRKPKRVKCELNDDDDDGDEDESKAAAECKEGVKKETTGDESMEEGISKGGVEQSNALVDAMMNDVEMKMAAEEEESKEEPADGRESDAEGGKKPPGPGCGPDGPPGVLVIHRRKGPKKQLRWRAAEDLEEIRYFELDVTERCNVTKSFTDMKNLERVDERQKFMLARKVGSEDNMTERTVWRPLVLVDNVPPAPDGNQSVERTVQHQRERSVLQALYFNKHMIPDCPVEPEPVDMYQTADPVHIPLEDVTGNPDSVNDFTSMPWPDPRSTPPHDSAAFNSPFFPSDLPPGAGFGPGGFPPPFPGGIPGPAPWQMPGPPPGAGGRPAGGPAGAGVLPPGMFPSLNQPPPGLGGGGNSPNMMLNLNLPPNVPPPGMFPGAGSFNSPPPDLGLMEGGGGAGRRGDGPNFRSGLPAPPWINNSRSFGGGGGGSGGSSAIPSQRGGHYGNRGAGGGNWNNRNNGGSGAQRGSAGERGRNNNSNSGAPWMQNNRGHSNRAGGGSGSRKW